MQTVMQLRSSQPMTPPNPTTPPTTTAMTLWSTPISRATAVVATPTPVATMSRRQTRQLAREQALRLVWWLQFEAAYDPAPSRCGVAVSCAVSHGGCCRAQRGPLATAQDGSQYVSVGLLAAIMNHSLGGHHDLHAGSTDDANTAKSALQRDVRSVQCGAVLRGSDRCQ